MLVDRTKEDAHAFWRAKCVLSACDGGAGGHGYAVVPGGGSHSGLLRTISLRRLRDGRRLPGVGYRPAAHPSRRQGHGEAALLVHRLDRHGHTERARQEDHPERHLSVYHGTFPVLPREQAGLAKLDTAQPQSERVLHQGPARRQEAGQGQLLVPRPRQLQHVRQRLLLETPQTLQEEGRAQGKGGSAQAAGSGAGETGAGGRQVWRRPGRVAAAGHASQEARRSGERHRQRLMQAQAGTGQRSQRQQSLHGGGPGEQVRLAQPDTGYQDDDGRRGARAERHPDRLESPGAPGAPGAPGVDSGRVHGRSRSDQLQRGRADDHAGKQRWPDGARQSASLAPSPRRSPASSLHHEQQGVHGQRRQRPVVRVHHHDHHDRRGSGDDGHHGLRAYQHGFPGQRLAARYNVHAVLRAAGRRIRHHGSRRVQLGEEPRDQRRGTLAMVSGRRESRRNDLPGHPVPELSALQVSEMTMSHRFYLV